jgi:hypothetical protein
MQKPMTEKIRHNFTPVLKIHTPWDATNLFLNQKKARGIFRLQTSDFTLRSSDFRFQNRYFRIFPVIGSCIFTQSEVWRYLSLSVLSPLMLWVRISIRARCTTLCDKVCQGLTAGQWFSSCTLVSSTNKTDCHDIRYNWNIVESGVKPHKHNVVSSTHHHGWDSNTLC